eukprot:scaffold313242_cov19-Tisochrysis_lutea.AAC.1
MDPAQVTLPTLCVRPGLMEDDGIGSQQQARTSEFEGGRALPTALAPFDRWRLREEKTLSPSKSTWQGEAVLQSCQRRSICETMNHFDTAHVIQSANPEPNQRVPYVQVLVPIAPEPTEGCHARPHPPRGRAVHILLEWTRAVPLMMGMTAEGNGDGDGDDDKKES